MKRIVVVLAALAAQLSCRGETLTDEWTDTRVSLILSWVSAGGTPASGASVDVFVFRDAPCRAPLSATTVSFFKLDAQGRLSTSVASVPTGSSFSACVATRLRAPSGSTFRDTTVTRELVRFTTPDRNAAVDTVRIVVVQP